MVFPNKHVSIHRIVLIQTARHICVSVHEEKISGVCLAVHTLHYVNSRAVAAFLMMHNKYLMLTVWYLMLFDAVRVCV